MTTWDDVIALYKDDASGSDSYNSKIGNAYLKVIYLLLDDSETAATFPGIAMYSLYVALSDYENQSVHIHWMIEPDVYEIYLTPKHDDEPDAIRVTVNEVIPTVKQFLQQLHTKRGQA